MGIRTDSDLQQPSVSDGNNPYTAEDMAIYSPQQIEELCQHQDEIFRLFEETANFVSALQVGIERMAPVIDDIYKNLKKLEEAVENDTTS